MSAFDPFPGDQVFVVQVVPACYLSLNQHFYWDPHNLLAYINNTGSEIVVKQKGFSKAVYIEVDCFKIYAASRTAGDPSRCSGQANNFIKKV